MVKRELTANHAKQKLGAFHSDKNNHDCGTDGADTGQDGCIVNSASYCSYVSSSHFQLLRINLSKVEIPQANAQGVKKSRKPAPNIAATTCGSMLLASNGGTATCVIQPVEQVAAPSTFTSTMPSQTIVSTFLEPQQRRSKEGPLFLSKKPADIFRVIRGGKAPTLVLMRFPALG